MGYLVVLKICEPILEYVSTFEDREFEFEFILSLGVMNCVYRFDEKHEEIRLAIEAGAFDGCGPA